MKQYLISMEMGVKEYPFPKHVIEAKNLLDLFNKLEAYKSKHTIYNDQIISIEELNEVSDVS